MGPRADLVTLERRNFLLRDGKPNTISHSSDTESSLMHTLLFLGRTLLLCV